jgi:hypothetical protein
MKGIRLNTNVGLNILAVHYVQFTRANGFFQPKVQNFLKLLFFHIILFEKFFGNKKSKMDDLIYLLFF